MWGHTIHKATFLDHSGGMKYPVGVVTRAVGPTSFLTLSSGKRDKEERDKATNAMMLAVYGDALTSPNPPPSCCPQRQPDVVMSLLSLGQ
jgi:hypothetical protein